MFQGFLPKLGSPKEPQIQAVPNSREHVFQDNCILRHTECHIHHFKTNQFKTNFFKSIFKARLF